MVLARIMSDLHGTCTNALHQTPHLMVCFKVSVSFCKGSMNSKKNQNTKPLTQEGKG